MRFGNLEKLGLNETAEYTLWSVEGEPVLTVVPATEANKKYFNALLKRSAKNLPQVKAGKITRELVRANREDERPIYAKHVICGWEGVVDEDDKEVPFSVAAAEEFFEALPDWLFDEIRTFCSEVQNFVDTPDPGEVAQRLGEDSNGS